MADMIIKPSTGNSLVFQDEGGDAALTIGTTGTITAAGTTSGFTSIPTVLGTVTAGNISNTDIVFPNGHAVQCTQFVQKAVQSVSSRHTFGIVPNFAHSITPTTDSSKILVNICGVWGDKDWVIGALYSKVTSGGSYAIISNAIHEDFSGTHSTNQRASFGNMYARGHQASAQPFNFQYLDSPATISEMFYTVYINTENSSAAYLNRSWSDPNSNSVGRFVSTITLTEFLY